MLRLFRRKQKTQAKQVEDRYQVPKGARPVNSNELDTSMEELKVVVFAKNFEQPAKIRASWCPSVDGYEIITRGQNGIGSSPCFPHDLPIESYNGGRPRIFFLEGKYYLDKPTSWSNRNHVSDYQTFYEQEGLGLKFN